MNLTLSDNLFFDQLRSQSLVKRAAYVFSKIHGPAKRPEIALEVSRRNFSPKLIAQCREPLEHLEQVVPNDLAQIIRMCAVVYSNFCDEIFADLDDFYFQSIGFEWLLHTEAAAMGGRYRDHLTHQMKVTSLGLEFLDTQTSDGEKLVKKIAGVLRKSQKISAFLRAHEIEDDLINEDVVYAAWMLAGMFHDVGYCFKMHIATANRLKKISEPLSSTPGDNLWKDVESLVNKNSYLFAYYQQYGDVPDSTSDEQITGLIRDTALAGTNHSVVGALYLLHLLGSIERRAKDSLASDQQLRKKLKLIFELAALAVLTHDIDSPKKQLVKTSESKKRRAFKESLKISFDEYPLSYLLGVCDQLQDWGRIRMTRLPIEDSLGKMLVAFPIDCDSIEVRKSKDKLDVVMSFKNASKEFMPSYPILGAPAGVSSTDVDSNDVNQALSKFREGRMYILNTVYGGCPLWNQVSISVRAGGATFTAADFFKDCALKAQIFDRFYT